MNGIADSRLIDFDFSGLPKSGFREKMIDHWMEEGCFKTRQDAVDNYGGHKFDLLCRRCDGSMLLNFKYDIGTDEKECFETVDNNFVIPVSVIDIVH